MIISFAKSSENIVRDFGAFNQLIVLELSLPDEYDAFSLQAHLHSFHACCGCPDVWFVIQHHLAPSFHFVVSKLANVSVSNLRGIRWRVEYHDTSSMLFVILEFTSVLLSCFWVYECSFAMLDSVLKLTIVLFLLPLEALESKSMRLIIPPVSVIQILFLVT